jgi:hypothetical protein
MGEVLRSYNPWLHRVSAVVVTALLIGLAFAPSTHADVSKKELLEVTTEIYGLPGQKATTIYLTQEQADEVDRLFKEIKVKLDNVESREGAVEIFNEAVVALNEHGLINGLDVKYVQRLMETYYLNPGLINLVENNDKNLYPLDYETKRCLIYARTKGIIADLNLQFLLWYVLYSIWDFFLLGSANLKLVKALSDFYLKRSQFKIFRYLNFIHLGELAEGHSVSFFTIGFDGIHNGTTELEAINGFNGIKITLVKDDMFSDEAIYLGVAMNAVINS